MDPMAVVKIRFPKETVVKMDEVLAKDNQGKNHFQQKSRAQLIREMVDKVLDTTWKPPLFSDQPDRPIKMPDKRDPKPRPRRNIRHQTTPAAKAYARKYLKLAKRKKFARA